MSQAQVDEERIRKKWGKVKALSVFICVCVHMSCRRNTADPTHPHRSTSAGQGTPGYRIGVITCHREHLSLVSLWLKWKTEIGLPDLFRIWWGREEGRDILKLEQSLAEIRAYLNLNVKRKHRNIINCLGTLRNVFTRLLSLNQKLMWQSDQKDWGEISERGYHSCDEWRVQSAVQPGLKAPRRRKNEKKDRWKGHISLKLSEECRLPPHREQRGSVCSRTETNSPI